MAARISPFDPTGPYAAELYRQAAHTGQVPILFLHRRLAGGGDLQLLEWLEPLTGEPDPRQRPTPNTAASDLPPHELAVQFHRDLATPADSHAELARIVHLVHDRARHELAWCGPLDDNPANVMRGADGRLVVIDLYYADGPRLYATAFEDPDQIVATIPADQRRYLDQIPITSAGGWQPGEQERLRTLIAEADARAQS